MQKEIFPAWSPREVAAHYGVPQTLDGDGQTVAIIDLGETLNLDELKLDFKKLAMPMPDIKIIDLGGDPVSGMPPGAIETHIDVEVVASVCPKAKLRVYRSAYSFIGMAEAIARAVADNVDVISVSWGVSEDGLTSGTIRKLEDALQAARAANITVCAASGDSGASGLTSPETHAPMPDPQGQVHCIYPASSTYVLACGGTEIMDRGGVQREVVWNNTPTGGRASGGGVSRQFSRPEWQKQFDIVSANPGDKSGRIVPDVSAIAAVKDWAFATRSGQLDLEGGTSAVTPFYAGMVVLANQGRIAAKKDRLGFVNDRLYAIAAQGGAFYDITEGNNAVAPDGKGYDATKSFDACTGWGSPRAAALISALVALP